jgi:hypothetical protein
LGHQPLDARCEKFLFRAISCESSRRLGDDRVTCCLGKYRFGSWVVSAGREKSLVRLSWLRSSGLSCRSCLTGSRSSTKSSRAFQHSRASQLTSHVIASQIALRLRISRCSVGITRPHDSSVSDKSKKLSARAARPDTFDPGQASQTSPGGSAALVKNIIDQHEANFHARRKKNPQNAPK